MVIAAAPPKPQLSLIERSAVFWNISNGVEYALSVKADHARELECLGGSVAAFSLSEDAISVEAASIDERACQERIVHIMEGGPEAFARRKAVYEIWKA